MAGKAAQTTILIAINHMRFKNKQTKILIIVSIIHHVVHSGPVCAVMWRRPYRSQVWGPGGIPSHPEEGELILPDSGERLLSWPVTTTLGPHS